ncbi:insulinoma-associated protein 1a [Vanacampus margaritifer]
MKQQGGGRNSCGFKKSAVVKHQQNPPRLDPSLSPRVPESHPPLPLPTQPQKCLKLVNMPRGFLVKRSKRVNLVSYRSRCEDEAEERKPLGGSGQEREHPSMRTHWPVPPLALAAAPERQSKAVRFGIPEGAYLALYSPTRPVSAERETERHPGSGLASPVSAEAFPAAAAALTALGHLFNMGSSSVTKRAADPECKVKPAAKRVKTVRKLHFEDDVTTSPVLGLKIRAIPMEQRPSPSGGNLAPRRGEFVCQLCGEAYADPLGLAQHRCSRIVRVEYRCPECDKVFSCPANLASHRRWHKPKTEQKGRPAEASVPGPSESEEEELLECKRHTCLQKHVATLQVPVDLSGAAGAHTCPMCGEALPGTERHRPPRAFRCKHCPAVLRSSPGLTRHVNRCHPSEDGNVVLLHLPPRHHRRVVSASISRF